MSIAIRGTQTNRAIYHAPIYTVPPTKTTQGIKNPIVKQEVKTNKRAATQITKKQKQRQYQIAHLPAIAPWIDLPVIGVVTLPLWWTTEDWYMVGAIVIAILVIVVILVVR